MYSNEMHYQQMSNKARPIINKVNKSNNNTINRWNSNCEKKSHNFKISEYEGVPHDKYMCDCKVDVRRESNQVVKMLQSNTLKDKFKPDEHHE